jgi:predicted AAA+ superfamily ATPase
MIERTTAALVSRVLDHYGKMAFVSGPRQVGKTTLARRLLAGRPQGLYFNWDIATDRRKLLADPYFFEKADRDPSRPFLVILDEIHKHPRWKNYLKGAYDGFAEEFRFLVTGSGRLDLFKKGGDSLVGRYFGIPLFPLTVGELLGRAPAAKEFRQMLDAPLPASRGDAALYRDLLAYGGFPEPFSRAEEAFHGMWAAERTSLLVREDIRDVTGIRNLAGMEHLARLLLERVGGPLSINSLREDLEVAYETVRDWVLVLARFYYLFTLSPWTGKLTRMLRKEPKAYLYDWADLPSAPARFENLVALHLLKAVATWNAAGEGPFSLHYLRDKEKREVDFVLLDGGKPLCLVECKSTDTSPAPVLRAYQERLGVATAVQLVNEDGVCRKMKNGPGSLWVISAARWLAMLP